MPRVQTFLSNDLLTEIDGIIQQRKAEGATPQDANLSNMTSMLVELGLRVYRLQNEKKEGGFNQMEFNRILLENSVKARLSSQKVLAALSLLQDIKASNQFDLTKISSDISDSTLTILNKLFPEVNDSEED